jgi:hypothetical protein
MTFILEHSVQLFNATLIRWLFRHRHYSSTQRADKINDEVSEGESKQFSLKLVFVIAGQSGAISHRLSLYLAAMHRRAILAEL